MQRAAHPTVAGTIANWLHLAAITPKVEALREVPFFAGLSDRQLVEMAAYLDEAVVEAGLTLVSEGRFNSTFWIILEGQVEVTVQGRLRRQIGPGGAFGAPSMFDGLEALATVVTTTPLRALVASHSQFAALVSNELVALRLRAESGDRLRSDLHALTERGPGTT